jgi:hypothetical protein
MSWTECGSWLAASSTSELFFSVLVFCAVNVIKLILILFCQHRGWVLSGLQQTAAYSDGVLFMAGNLISD